MSATLTASKADAKQPLLVQKRSGTLVNYDRKKIEQAVKLCLVNSCSFNPDAADTSLNVTKVTNRVDRFIKQMSGPISVETVQDLVEQALYAVGLAEAGRQYVIYREQHQQLRAAAAAVITQAELDHLRDDNARFKTDLAAFQHFDKYARYNDEKKRRETYPESVRRVINFLRTATVLRGKGDVLSEVEWLELETALLNEDASCAMRVMQMAGPALDRCNTGCFNCTYVELDCVDAFAEALYLSMQGCGVGFSVESRAIEQLPAIRPLKGVLTGTSRSRPASLGQSTWHAKSGGYIYPHDNTLTIEWSETQNNWTLSDSTEAWCDSVKLLMFSLFDGYDVAFDYSRLRDAGVRLKTKGGTASGPEPLKNLHAFIRKVFRSRQGRRLRDIDAHDVACYIGKVGQLGGVRRAAMISVSDFDSEPMRMAKFGAFWNDPSKEQRTMANNSACYEEHPSMEAFMQEWVSLAISKSGERGIFNRGSLDKQMPKRRRRDRKYGTNPCGEIILPNCGMCNLSIAVVRVDDTLDNLRYKVRIATLFGVLQSMLTDFKYVRPVWADNVNEERLLGVDLLGAMDHPMLRDTNPQRDAFLGELKQIVLDNADVYCKRFSIPMSAATTCIKPGGNSSVRYSTGQSMSGWLTEHMIRNVEVAKRNPMYRFLKDCGVPSETSYRDSNTAVFSFPMPAPKGAFIVSDIMTDAEGNVVATKPRRTAIDQLNDWLAFKTHWTEHNPSVSIYVADDEWFAVGDWVIKHWDLIGGLSFFPLDCGVYKQAPMTPITKAKYEEFLMKFPKKIPWEQLALYDAGQDHTEQRKELACAGGACSL